jgi:hypothetical protein
MSRPTAKITPPHQDSSEKATPIVTAGEQTSTASLQANSLLMLTDASDFSEVTDHSP